MPTINPLTPTSTQAAQLVGMINSVQQSPGYVFLSQGDLPEVIPGRLREKCVAGLLMTSTGDNDTTYALLNLYRKDNDQMDQHPLCFVASSTGGINCVFLIDHASHAGRTQEIPLDFPDSSTMRLISGCLSTSNSGLSSTGLLSDLLGTSNADAFRAGMVKMEQQISTKR